MSHFISCAPANSSSFADCRDWKVKLLQRPQLWNPYLLRFSVLPATTMVTMVFTTTTSRITWRSALQLIKRNDNIHIILNQKKEKGSLTDPPGLTSRHQGDKSHYFFLRIFHSPPKSPPMRSITPFSLNALMSRLIVRSWVSSFSAISSEVIWES